MVSSPRAAALLLFFVILPMASDAFKCSQNDLTIKGRKTIQDVPIAQKKVVDCNTTCFSWIETASTEEVVFHNACSDEYIGKNMIAGKCGYDKDYQSTFDAGESTCSQKCLTAACVGDFCNDYNKTVVDEALIWVKKAEKCPNFPKYVYVPAVNPPLATVIDSLNPTTTLKPSENPKFINSETGSSSAPTSSGQGWFSMMKMSLIYGGMAFLMATVFGLN